MRVAHIARLGLHLLDGLGYLLIGVSCTADVGTNGLVALAIKVIHTSKVARVAYVHGVGDGLHRWLRLILACLQILEEDVVGIVGSDEALDGQPHLLAKECRTDIAKVARRHTHHELVCQALLLHLRIGIEIVESLRQETCHIDRIGRSQLHVGIEVGIHKGVLHQCLAVVKHTIHLHCRDVLSQCGELALLNRADLSLRIEHIHTDAIHSEEAIGHGTARIATGSH